MTSKYHAHHEHERTVVTLTVVAAGLGLLCLVLGWFEYPKVIGLIELTAGALLLPMSFGLWRAREWARIGVGALCCAGGIVLAWYTWKEDPEIFEQVDVQSMAVRFGLTFGQGGFLLLPHTGRAFAEARAAQERERTARLEMRGSRSAYKKGTASRRAAGSRADRGRPAE